MVNDSKKEEAYESHGESADCEEKKKVRGIIGKCNMGYSRKEERTETKCSQWKGRS